MVQMSSLILGQYKVIRVLRMEEEYAAVLAVDIMDRMQTICLLNVYEGKAARRYAAVFEATRHCPEFIKSKLSGESLIAVFSWHEAPLINSVFYENSGQDWRTRLEYAEKIFHLVLSIWDQPCEIGCAAMQSDNLAVSMKDKKLYVNYCMEPGAERLPQREILCLAGDQIKKILFETWKTELPERRFVFDVTHGRWKNAVQLNSAWNEAKIQIEAAYTERESKGFLSRTFGRLIMNIKWKKELSRRTYGTGR